MDRMSWLRLGFFSKGVTAVVLKIDGTSSGQQGLVDQGGDLLDKQVLSKNVRIGSREHIADLDFRDD
jgi:hypothetical protein